MKPDYDNGIFPYGSFPFPVLTDEIVLRIIHLCLTYAIWSKHFCFIFFLHCFQRLAIYQQIKRKRYQILFIIVSGWHSRHSCNMIGCKNRHLFCCVWRWPSLILQKLISNSWEKHKANHWNQYHDGDFIPDKTYWHQKEY